MKNKIIKKPIILGFLGTTAMLVIYFTIVGLVSGWGFSFIQFSQNWYFILSLAFGFGIQVGLYGYLKQLIKNHSDSISSSGKTIAVTGTTSTLSMISCCAHYLANILPLLGIAGVLSFIGQYQKELFGVGIFFNLFGIAYIIKQIIRFKKQT